MATSAIRDAAAGDAIAFARIVDAYHADMIRVAYVVSGGSQELADDAVQAAWAIAWRGRGSEGCAASNRCRTCSAHAAAHRASS